MTIYYLLSPSLTPRLQTVKEAPMLSHVFKGQLSSAHRIALCIIRQMQHVPCDRRNRDSLPTIGELDSLFIQLAACPDAIAILVKKWIETTDATRSLHQHPPLSRNLWQVFQGKNFRISYNAAYCDFQLIDATGRLCRDKSWEEHFLQRRPGGIAGQPPKYVHYAIINRRVAEEMCMLCQTPEGQHPLSFLVGNCGGLSYLFHQKKDRTHLAFTYKNSPNFANVVTTLHYKKTPPRQREEVHNINRHIAARLSEYSVIDFIESGNFGVAEAKLETLLPRELASSLFHDALCLAISCEVWPLVISLIKRRAPLLSDMQHKLLYWIDHQGIANFLCNGRVLNAQRNSQEFHHSWVVYAPMFVRNQCAFAKLYDTLPEEYVAELLPYINFPPTDNQFHQLYAAWANS